jgi:hypothetical protein
VLRVAVVLKCELKCLGVRLLETGERRGVDDINERRKSEAVDQVAQLGNMIGQDRVGSSQRIVIV